MYWNQQILTSYFFTKISGGIAPHPRNKDRLSRLSGCSWKVHLLKVLCLHCWTYWHQTAHGYNTMVAYCGLLCRVSGCIAIAFIDTAEVSQCYQVNMKNYCFYTNGSVSNWSKAREFCASVNSTLPIITDENIDNVFQQFIVNDANTVIQHRSVWIDAYARQVNNSVKWHWINGQPSGRPILYRRVNLTDFSKRDCLWPEENVIYNSKSYWP